MDCRKRNGTINNIYFGSYNHSYKRYEALSAVKVVFFLFTTFLSEVVMQVAEINFGLKSAQSVRLTLQVTSTHRVCDVYLFAISLTSLDRSLHYHLLSTYSSAVRWAPLISSCPGCFNGFWVLADCVVYWGMKLPLKTCWSFYSFRASLRKVESLGSSIIFVFCAIHGQISIITFFYPKIHFAQTIVFAKRITTFIGKPIAK